MRNKKILVVDDEPQLLKLLETIFRKEGYHQLFCAGSVKEAFALFIKNRPDIAVLDIMLPDGDGLSLMNQMKKVKDIPVLFLSARGEAEDKILGLGMGADDYIVKPFLPKELILRLQAVLKRTYAQSSESEQPVFELPACRVDLGRAEVFKGDKAYPLTAKEHTILLLLYRHANAVVTLDTLCQSAWEDGSYGYENTLMVHIRHIREKIETDPSSPVSLVTVKGLGYKLIV